MLCSLPRSRMVVAISYGCIGRSQREASTARASGFEIGLRRSAIAGSFVNLLVNVYPSTSIRSRTSVDKYLIGLRHPAKSRREIREVAAGLVAASPSRENGGMPQPHVLRRERLRPAVAASGADAAPLTSP